MHTQTRARAQHVLPGACAFRRTLPQAARTRMAGPRTTCGPPSRETLTALTGVTRRDPVRRGPTEAEPTAKQPGESGTASGLVTSRPKAGHPCALAQCSTQLQALPGYQRKIWGGALRPRGPPFPAQIFGIVIGLRPESLWTATGFFTFYRFVCKMEFKIGLTAWGCRRT